MPDITVFYRPGPHMSVTQQREQLAVTLARELPPIVVKALGEAGASLTETQMTIDIVQYHASAYNVPDLAVGIVLGPGDHGCVQSNANRVCAVLTENLLGWLSLTGQQFPYAMQGLNELDVWLRFAQASGMSSDVSTGAVKSVW